VKQSALRVAVVIPCFNEVVAIGKVVADFRAALPDARIIVFDNNSRDASAEMAARAGAEVRHETRQGKGQVIRRAFADIEADVYLLVDGDDTYDPATAPIMVSTLLGQRLDMITGVRMGESEAAYRRGHRLGNRLLSGTVRSIFGAGVSDMLSGYRAFSRRFVKSFPASARGFETETEFTVHALQLRLPVAEVATAYKERPQGSVSKLHTYADGVRIARTIMLLVKEERPLQFFVLSAALLLFAGLAFGTPVVLEFLATHFVTRLPSAVAATGLVLLSFLSLSSGLVLDSVARGRREQKRLAYLAIPGPP
jgi:glycosyltransferase involved in cell wall biosynthesis